ncbi:uncharacterized protein LOC125225054 [Leguminivora glycinivorella]|uniref:uncharacterized protein LOC125225054 n=1 Tax=Leguminivora glycinivorella TaxID=1035111 RepID=UPI00200CAA69|nr:uncharacterized protein LOC125225054 [Leguminivora glycinivorella]
MHMGEGELINLCRTQQMLVQHACHYRRKTQLRSRTWTRRPLASTGARCPSRRLSSRLPPRPHELTVVYAQKHPPIITFGKPDAVVGGLLRANCTSAPAAPAPRLTWYIDNEKVDEESVRYFSYRVSSSTRTKGGGGYRHRKHQHRYIAPEFNYTAKYWALVSETTAAPVLNHTKHTKCTLNEHSEEAAKIRERPRVHPATPISCGCR